MTPTRAPLPLRIAGLPLSVLAQAAGAAATGFVLGLCWMIYGALRLVGRAPVHR